MEDSNKDAFADPKLLVDIVAEYLIFLCLLFTIIYARITPKFITERFGDDRVNERTNVALQWVALLLGSERSRE